MKKFMKKLFSLNVALFFLTSPSFAVGNPEAAAFNGIYSGKNIPVENYLAKDDEAVAYGEIYSGNNSETNSRSTIGVAKASITTNVFDDEYLVLDYTVAATVPTMLSSKTIMTLYNEDTGQLLSKTPLKVTSSSSTPLLSKSVTMWVGNAKNVRVKMISSTVTCNDGQTYNLQPYKSYVATRN